MIFLISSVLLFLLSLQTMSHYNKLIDTQSSIRNYFFLSFNLGKILKNHVDCLETFKEIDYKKNEKIILKFKKNDFSSLNLQPSSNMVEMIKILKEAKIFLKNDNLFVRFRKDIFNQKLGPYPIHFSYHHYNLIQMIDCHFL